jgi:hypothetical protein
MKTLLDWITNNKVWLVGFGLIGFWALTHESVLLWLGLFLIVIAFV